MVITPTDSVKEKKMNSLCQVQMKVLCQNLEKRNHCSNGGGGGVVMSERTTILRFTNRETNSVNIINL